MSSRLVLAPTKHPPVPEQEVRLTVAVDSTTCGAPTDPGILGRLQQYESGGFRVPIARIVAYAGIHYEGEAQDHWGVGEGRARIQSAWQDICNWNPRAELDRTSAPRLVFDQRPNSRRQANFSEVIAVGAGLVVAAAFYEMPYRFWRPTPGLSPYDFRAPGPAGMELQLEVRGRFEGNLGDAKAQVRKKFGANAFLARQLGVIFAPRTDVEASHPDLTLLDPENNGMPAATAKQDLRALLLHYVPFFARQNFDDFADRLRALAALPDADFDAYLNQGDPVLRAARVRRTAFRFEGEEFVGTAWSGVAWPKGLIELQTDVDLSSGCFYWGIWTRVLDALREGQLQDIADMETSVGTYTEGQLIYVLLDDATALAWAPTQEALLAME